VLVGVDDAHVSPFAALARLMDVRVAELVIHRPD
jgi:hypothetical protein